MVVEPRHIVKEILQYVGEKGIVAGGAIRDIILGHTPKDYDVFIYKESWFRDIVQRQGIFDQVPKKVPEPQLYGASTKFEVWNTALHGETVQLIYAYEFEPQNLLHLFPSQKDHISADEIVQRFPFTVNMVYATHNGKTVILPEAKKAFKYKQVIYNHKHEPTYPRASRMIPFILNRGFYLAIKLDFSFPRQTLEGVYGIGYYEDELSEREWVKEEETSNVPF